MCETLPVFLQKYFYKTKKSSTKKSFKKRGKVSHMFLDQIFEFLKMSVRKKFYRKKLNKKKIKKIKKS